MAQAKKFGAFGGVFTPSILTILGVIMYMRLGWVVGEAGLIMALGIIVISHVISVSTGLSISSIATDKKIKGGGIYYILSRSLGLPMGGAIGIALGIGLAISISLYLIGFAESFLSIQWIRDFLGLEQDINGYRIIGTAAIIILMIIAFISTSLAIKTQYYILAAIALSLVSIFTGFAINTDFAPDAVLLNSSRDGVPLEIIFGVFFPAVTGFTVGVAMSGDLKDPKKSIPPGTMIAIGMGFIIYVGLAIALAYSVNRELLISDPNYLMKVAWFSPFVIAGIWGATLSSALGGILGGPRIFQALSGDKITPKVLGKGYGASNEPRNALILIFLIAEAGILIGELNLIARIVSMFFLASYGFINLSFFLESWASTDFRPYFKINRYIGLVGFIACFAVMYELDKGSMFASLVIMLLIYFFLRHKQIRNDYGDVWQSVWSSIIRFALHKMDKDNIEERNWRPNIMLFSGGTTKRPYLIEFGKALVGKHGMLSNFDLIEKTDAKTLFPIQKKTVPPDLEKTGVFVRQQYVRDIYDGIETIARTYGFSGIEPNTVILGWGRQTSNPKRFVQLINSLNELDLNILLLDFDKERKFGNYKKIDIWWKSDGRQGILPLILSKFIGSSYEWRNVSFRLLIVNPVIEDSERLKNNALNILDNLRINAEIKVINNQIEQKSFYDILLNESGSSDLIFIGMPDIKEDDSVEFIEKTNKLLLNIGTVALVKACANFKHANVGLPSDEFGQTNKKIQAIIPERDKIPEITYPEKQNLAKEVLALYTSEAEFIEKFCNNYISKIFQKFKSIEDSIEELINVSFEKIEKDVLRSTKLSNNAVLNIINAEFLVKSIRLINEKKDEIVSFQQNLLQEAIDYFINNQDNIIGRSPERIKINLDANDLSFIKSDKSNIKIFKLRKKAFRSGKKIRRGIGYQIKFKKLINNQLQPDARKTLFEFEKQLGVFSLQYILEINKLIYTFNNSLLNVLKKSQNINTKEIIESEKQKINDFIQELLNFRSDSQRSLHADLILSTTGIIQNISNDTSKIPANTFIKSINKKSLIQLDEKIKEAPSGFSNNLKLSLDKTEFEIRILLLKNRLKNIFSEANAEISKTINENVIDFLEKLKSGITHAEPLKSISPPGEEDTYTLIIDKIVETTLRNARNNINKLPANMHFISDASLGEFKEVQFENVVTIKVSTLRLIDFLIQENLLDPMRKLSSKLSFQLDKIITETNDIVRLIKLAEKKEEEPENQETNATDDYDNFIRTQKDKIESLIKKTRDLLNETNTNINEQISTTNEKLSLYNILKYSGNIKQYIQKREVKRKIASINQVYKKVKSFYQKQTEKFWYKQSDAILFAKKIQEEKTDNVIHLNDFLELKDKVSPDPKVLNKLPFYYTQLFIQKHYYQDEFWFGRHNLLLKAEKAIKWYQRGHHGGILISGDHNSGKTFLAQHIVSIYLQNQQLYTLNPPSGGSIEPNVFKKSFQNVTGISGSYRTIFSQIPEHSVIIIDDLELWWEKSENGIKVIHEIINLIKTYSNKFLFIITANKQSLEVINEIVEIDQYILSIIECTPFNSQALKEIILFRHQSSGMKLQLEGSKRMNIISSKYASLFSKYFNYSNGNIGIALYSWIANINSFQNETIFIKIPILPDLNVLNSLDHESFIYLMQFILHKQLTINKLQRITLEKREDVLEKISFLKRIGLINELPNKVYEINKYLYIHIYNKIKEKEML